MLNRTIFYHTMAGKVPRPSAEGCPKASFRTNVCLMRGVYLQGAPKMQKIGWSALYTCCSADFCLQNKVRDSVIKEVVAGREKSPFIISLKCSLAKYRVVFLVFWLFYRKISCIFIVRLSYFYSAFFFAANDFQMHKFTLKCAFYGTLYFAGNFRTFCLKQAARRTAFAKCCSARRRQHAL